MSNQFLIDVSTELTNLNVEHLVDDDSDILVDGVTFSDKHGHWTTWELPIKKIEDGVFIHGQAIHGELEFESDDPTAVEVAEVIKRTIDGRNRCNPVTVSRIAAT